MRKPNFFIIGAPKCGTTALAEYLSEHPDIFFSDPKELDFFDVDILDTYRRFRFNSEKEYLKCFEKAKGYQIIGEGSVLYLYSKEAVPRTLECNPSAKFIVVLRNPVDMAYSLHAQNLFTMDEDEKDFAAAWRLQGIRREGKHIPRYCRDPQILQYGTVCSVGEQMERLYGNVARENVLVIWFDDFVKNTKTAYREVLEFLGIPDDGRESFPIVNRNKHPRYRLAYLLIKRLEHSPVYPISRSIKKLLRIQHWNFLVWFDRHNRAAKDRKKPSKGEREEIAAYFRKDIHWLEAICKKDLSHWASL